MCKDHTAGVTTDPFDEKRKCWRYQSVSEELNLVITSGDQLIDRLAGLKLPSEQYVSGRKYFGLISALKENTFDLNLGGKIITGIPKMPAFDVFDFVCVEPDCNNLSQKIIIKSFKPSSVADFPNRTFPSRSIGLQNIKFDLNSKLEKGKILGIKWI